MPMPTTSLNNSLPLPTVESIREYSNSVNGRTDPQKFYDYYSQRDWKIGGEAITNWQRVYDTWSAREFSKPVNKTSGKPNVSNMRMATVEDPEFCQYLDFFMKHGPGHGVAKYGYVEG